MPTLKCVNDHRAARFEGLGQFPDGGSSDVIKDETEFLPVESFVDILIQVVALEDYLVTSALAHLLSSFSSADNIQRFDSRELRELNDVLAHPRIGCGLTDPVTRHESNVSVQQEIGGGRVNSYHRELQRIRFVAHRHRVAYRGNNLICPGALLVGGKNQDSLSLQGDIHLGSDLGDSANTLCTYRGWEGWPDAINPADKQKVRWIERGRFHRGENILLAKSRFGDAVEFNDIRRF